MWQRGHAKNLSTPQAQLFFVYHSFQTKYSSSNFAYYFPQKRTLNLTSEIQEALNDTPTAQSGKRRNDDNLPNTTTPPSKFAVFHEKFACFWPVKLRPNQSAQ
jgi:hypothetical protein